MLLCYVLSSHQHMLCSLITAHIIWILIPGTDMDPDKYDTSHIWMNSNRLIPYTGHRLQSVTDREQRTITSFGIIYKCIQICYITYSLNIFGKGYIHLLAILLYFLLECNYSSAYITFQYSHHKRKYLFHSVSVQKLYQHVTANTVFWGTWYNIHAASWLIQMYNKNTLLSYCHITTLILQQRIPQKGYHQV